jgi:hypothetical protein
VRISVAACVLGGLCALAGGWLVARWALGLVVIAEGGLLVAWGVLRDDGQPPAAITRPGEGGTLAEILERARDAS